MPSSNILLFDANKANMMADEQYNTNTQRLNGVQSGIASSQLQNKTLYQVSLVAYAIAQIMNQNGLDANDTAAVSAFVANLSGTMLQKVADLASTQEAKSGVVNNKWMSPALVKAAIDFMTVVKSGATMTGPLILSGNPTEANGAATKSYVDDGLSKVIDHVVVNKQVTGIGTFDCGVDLGNYSVLFIAVTIHVVNVPNYTPRSFKFSAKDRYGKNLTMIGLNFDVDQNNKHLAGSAVAQKLSDGYWAFQSSDEYTELNITGRDFFVGFDIDYVNQIYVDIRAVR